MRILCMYITNVKRQLTSPWLTVHMQWLLSVACAPVAYTFRLHIIACASTRPLVQDGLKTILFSGSCRGTSVSRLLRYHAWVPGCPTTTSNWFSECNAPEIYMDQPNHAIFKLVDQARCMAICNASFCCGCALCFHISNSWHLGRSESCRIPYCISLIPKRAT